MRDDSGDDVSRWRARYQAVVPGEPASRLDDLIVQAAARHTVRVCIVRRSIMVLALVLVAVLLWPLREALQSARQPARPPPPGIAHDFGRQEGATRYYLLNVAGLSYTGPGSLERPR